jgi:hypothetical protein
MAQANSADLFIVFHVIAEVGCVRDVIIEERVFL